MDDIKFSVIMPVYNSEKYLREALLSIAQQTYQRYEIIIVNNGSHDGSQLIIDDFVKENSSKLIKIIKLEPNMGISYARNIGVDSANGEFVAFLDSDDIWYSEKLNILDYHLRQNPEIDVIWHYENHGTIEKNVLVEYRSLNNNRAYEELLFGVNQLSPSATAVRKSLFLSINGFCTDYVNGEEDYDLWLRLARQSAHFHLVRKSLGLFRIHQDSTSSKFKVHSDAVMKMVEKHFAWMENSSQYDKKLLKRKLNNKRAEADFGYGRFLLKGKAKRLAFSYFIKSLRTRPFWWKPYAGIFLIPFSH